MELILKKKTKKVIEENKKFVKDTKSKELLIVILKGHLYIERELIGMLTENIIDENILRGTTFKQKLDLAKSVGLIDESYGSIGKVNKIRNSYAHNINYKFDEKDFEDLLSTLSKEEKAEFLKEYNEWKDIAYDGTIPEFNFKVQILLTHIWFSAATCRVHGRRAIELRLEEKEIEVASKLIKDKS